MRFNLYDVIARICEKISSFTKKFQEELYKEYVSDIESVNSTIENEFSFFNKHTSKSIIYSTFSDVQINILFQFIENNCDKKLLFLLSYLDNYIDFQKSLDSYCQNKCINKYKLYSFKTISNNEHGYLIPRFYSNWTKKNCNSPDTLMKNPLSIMRHYLWIDNINGWEVWNVYSNEWSNSKDGFIIACSPLTKSIPFSYKLIKEDPVNHFYLTTYDKRQQEELFTRINSILDISNEHKANVLLFPEMLLSNEHLKRFNELISTHWQNDYPKIICSPSSEYKIKDRWYNRLSVFDNYGNRVFSYNKNVSYEHKTTDNQVFFEPICSDKMLYIIHINGVGRIGIIICADIFSDDIKEILYEKYKISILLVPSFTNGRDQISRGFARCLENSIDVIWCNSCAALSKDNQIVVKYMAYGHNEKIERYVKRCSNECLGCIVIIEISNDYNGEGKISKKRINLGEY